MVKVEELKRGTQVKKIGDPPEYGFVTSVTTRGFAFVRYWQMRNGRPVYALRTKSCSEATYLSSLQVCDQVPEDWVSYFIKEFCT